MWCDLTAFQTWLEPKSLEEVSSSSILELYLEKVWLSKLCINQWFSLPRLRREFCKFAEMTNCAQQLLLAGGPSLRMQKHGNRLPSSKGFTLSKIIYTLLFMVLSNYVWFWMFCFIDFEQCPIEFSSKKNDTKCLSFNCFIRN